MFKRLFLNSQMQKIFSQCKIDKSHELMFTKSIVALATKYFTSAPESQKNNLNINININHNTNNQINININNNTQKSKKEEENQHKRDELIKIIFKKIRSSNEVQRIKGLIVAHSIIRKTFNQDFMDLVADQMDKYIVSSTTFNPKQEKVKENPQEKLQDSQKEFIQKNIISFYCLYLKKFIINIQTFRFAQKYLSFPNKESYNIIEVINQGFVILNLCNYILQAQFTFNKMGRYYLEYNEIINLFIMYLNDLIIYNSYIKELSKLSVKNFKQATSEEIRHHFLFVTESQKTSDRLYEFFYNRYYYTQVKKIILMPTFLNIHSEQFNSLANYVKKNDPELASLVKNSKFQAKGSRSRSKPKTFASEQSEFNSSKANKTDFLFKSENDYFSILSMIKDNTSQQTFSDLDEITIKKYTIAQKQ